MLLRFMSIAGCLTIASATGCGGASPAVSDSTRITVPDSKQLSVVDLNDRPVVGSLGIPLGTATEVRAVIVSGESLRMKAYSSQYLLRVIEVGGKPLADAPTLTFEVPPFIDADLANDPFDLHELKTGKKTGQLTGEQRRELEKDYVGTTRRIVVYEGGRFDGRPWPVPNDVPIWADVGFGYSSYLVVIADRDKKRDAVDPECGGGAR